LTARVNPTIYGLRGPIRGVVLSEEVRFARLSHTYLGGDPESVCLPLEFLNGWLFGVNPKDWRKTAREK
jgi:hypothetical protein